MEVRSSKTTITPSENRLEGYAAVFNSPTTIQEQGRSFTEVIRPNAFRAIPDDVICNFNHDANMLLGRTSSGTLQLKQDERGLWFSVDIPNTPTGNEIRELVRRNDLSGCSFAFVVKQDRWNHEPVLRELLDVELHDVSIVTNPAYLSTNVGLRGKKIWQMKINLMRQDLPK